MIKTRITAFRQPYWMTNFETRNEWFQERCECLTYKSEKNGEEAAEEVFELTNAPKECLNEKAQILQEKLNYRGPSVSVGDIIKVEPIVRSKKTFPEYYMCMPFGWEKFNGNVIELLKHLNY